MRYLKSINIESIKNSIYQDGATKIRLSFSDEWNCEVIIGIGDSCNSVFNNLFALAHLARHADIDAAMERDSFYEKNSDNLFSR